VKVVLDLPVLKKRTLDQQLKIPIQEGSLDFRALEESLDWLEGSFLDITHDKDKLASSGRSDLRRRTRPDRVKLDERPRRCVVGASGPRVRRRPPQGPCGCPARRGRRRQAQDVAVAHGRGDRHRLVVARPRSLEVGGGLIMFGGEEQPGMVDLKVIGSINDRGPARSTARSAASTPRSRTSAWARCC